MDKKEGWKYKEAAEKYLKIVNVLVSRRKEILSVISNLEATFITDCSKVLDLGCGNGDITDGILKIKPKETGLFINGDRFRGESTNVEQWEFDNGIKFMVQQIKEKFGKDKTFDEVK